MDKKEIGSLTAKDGFLNEKDICKKFLNYKKDLIAQHWLKIMGYNPNRIERLLAIQIPVRLNHKKALALGITEEKFEESIKFKKADIQIRVEITINKIVHVENISLKKANKSAGYNQVDKRPVLTYQKIWHFSDNIAKWLKAFTGDIIPADILPKYQLEHIKDRRRLFLTEIPNDALKEIIEFFSAHKTLVVTDILRGRGGLSAEWFLVTRKDSDNTLSWILKDINFVVNFYAQGSVHVTPRGSLKIGRVTMQRKGGTPDPTSLQFKINPLELFEVADG